MLFGFQFLFFSHNRDLYNRKSQLIVCMSCYHVNFRDKIENLRNLPIDEKAIIITISDFPLWFYESMRV